ncbi:unnamed protein product [Cylindrotheca closterium]|uniref:DUF6816 domain-containing protein n=1 Tax=Cylindrotheca closterium TaxID=2856 RepID=A0AAD2FAG7_9STRA|nr:unnamed protein product [Cylindrotheca closterium]
MKPLKLQPLLLLSLVVSFIINDGCSFVAAFQQQPSSFRELASSFSPPKACVDDRISFAGDYMEESAAASRRQFLKQSVLLGGGALTSTICTPQSEVAFAASDSSIFPGSSASSVELESGLLESRVMEDLLSPPTYGLEIPDIYYPSYFAGVWGTSSVGTNVEAPCGIPLFGGNRTYAAAKNEIGETNALKYRARFVTSSDRDAAIADREFNVREIAKATMGANSVVDVPLATPNKFCCLLAPAGSPNLLTVDIIALARRQENNEKTFDCSEVVRQIVAPANQNKPQAGIPTAGTNKGGVPTLLKEIETVSLYTPGPLINGQVQTIKCRQRTATFLLPSQDDPVAYQMWQMTRGRPIDVRFYDVTYTRQS